MVLGRANDAAKVTVNLQTADRLHSPNEPRYVLSGPRKSTHGITPCIKHLPCSMIRNNVINPSTGFYHGRPRPGQ